MELVDFLSKYWSLIAFIGVTIGSWVRFTASVADMKIDMKNQKEEHDKQVGRLETSHEFLLKRFEEHKDNISASISLIQQDIREIMTILKTKRK